MSKKFSLKKKEEGKLIKPAEFDILFSMDGPCEVGTPYPVINAYAIDTVDNIKTAQDVLIRRCMLEKVFKNRVEFLFDNIYKLFVAAIEECNKMVIEKYNLGTEITSKIRFNYHRMYSGNYLYIREVKTGKKVIDLSYIHDYAEFGGLISRFNCVDISNIVMTNMYNDFVFDIQPIILECGVDVLSHYVFIFKDFQMRFISVFHAIMDELATIYGPAGLPDVEVKVKSSVCNDCAGNCNHHYEDNDDYYPEDNF